MVWVKFISSVVKNSQEHTHASSCTWLTWCWEKILGTHKTIKQLYLSHELSIKHSRSDWTAKGGGGKLYGFEDDDVLYTQRQEDDIQLTSKELKHSATGNGWIHLSIQLL